MHGYAAASLPKRNGILERSFNLIDEVGGSFKMDF